MKLTLDDGKKLRALHINRIEMGYDDDKEFGKGYFLKMYGDFIVQTGHLKQGLEVQRRLIRNYDC